MVIASDKVLVPEIHMCLPHMRLLVAKYIEGTLLSKAKRLKDRFLLHSIGRNVGLLVQSLKKFNITDSSKTVRRQVLEWNFSNFYQATQSLLDPSQAALVKAVGTDLERILSLDVWQLCHYDLNDDNIIITDSDYIGIIDFGDVDMGPKITDISICLCYIVFNCEGNEDIIESSIREVLTGYMSVQPLSKDELSSIPTLVVARALMSLAIQLKNIALHPDNRDYLSCSVESSKKFLRYYVGHKDVFHSFFSGLSH
jgi:Ser/Thr protein kinase RdoA (MazF antagonist)